MKKIILMTLGFAAWFYSSAQVLINIQFPGLGLTVKSQLWNLSLVNTTNQDINVQIEMTMTDVMNNQRVLTGTSKIFPLPRGLKQVRMSDVLPVAYAVGVGYNIDGSQDGFLPVGFFNICYTAIKWVNDQSERLSDECQEVEIEPISPPLLIMPADSEYVDVTRPFFNWLPPTPFNLFNNLVYDWTLVEVQPTQSAADALQENIPVLTQQSIPFTTLQFPLASPELDTSKLYAWRVVAKNGNAPVATSETWTFRVKKLALDTSTAKIDGFYAKLNTKEDESYTICTGVLRFEFQNEMNNPLLDFSIGDISIAAHSAMKLDSSNYIVHYGENFIQIDLRQSNLVDRHLYLLKLTNQKNETWYLRFEYRRPED